MSNAAQSKYLGWLACLSILVLVSCKDESDTYEQLEEAANKISEESEFGSTYWFEIETSLGWDKVILVFGYGDNRSACNAVKEFAEKTNPQRAYRCLEAIRE